MIVIILLSVSTSVCYSGTVYCIQGNMSSTTIVYNILPTFNREILGSIPVSAQPDSALNDSAVPSVSVDNSAHNVTSSQNDSVSVSVDHSDSDHITSEPEQHSPPEGDAQSDIAPPPWQSHRRHQPPNQYGTAVSYPGCYSSDSDSTVLDAGTRHPHNEGE